MVEQFCASAAYGLPLCELERSEERSLVVTSLFT